MTTDALIIATGASARWLEIGSDRKLSGHGVSTCATCDGYFFRGKPIAVIGGGDSAMEEAIYLTRFASKVSVVHRRDTLRASKIMQDKAMANPKIEFIWDSEVAEVKDGGKGEVTGIVVRNLKTGHLSELPLDGVFIAIGHTPNTSLFAGQIELDANGYIMTHARFEDQRAWRVCGRRRAGPHLSPGDHRGRIGLHGRARRRALPRRTARRARDCRRSRSRELMIRRVMPSELNELLFLIDTRLRPRVVARHEPARLDSRRVAAPGRVAAGPRPSQHLGARRPCRVLEVRRPGGG